MAPASHIGVSLEGVLGAAAHTRIVVVGDVMLDRYLIGTVDRISPEAPVPVFSVRGGRQAPGGAANVASGLRALGAKVTLIGAIGNDRAGRHLDRALARRGIDADRLAVLPDRPTTVKLRVLARHQQVLRIDRETRDPLSDEAAATLGEHARGSLAGAAALVLQDYDKGTLSVALVRDLIRQARDRKVPVVVDPKLRMFEAYRGADVFKPNEHEVAAALAVEEASLDRESLTRLAKRVGCRHLLVTRGARGMTLLPEGEGGPIHIPSHAREVYDVSGAGDTVTAVLAASLASGLSVENAARLSNFAAGLAVARLGARPVSARTLRDALERDRREEDI